jgi:hypothetical protein
LNIQEHVGHSYRNQPMRHCKAFKQGEKSSWKPHSSISSATTSCLLLHLSASIERTLHPKCDLPVGKGILALDLGSLAYFSISRNLYPTVRPKSAHSCMSYSAEPPEEAPLSSTNRCYHSIMRYRRALSNVMKTESRV